MRRRCRRPAGCARAPRPALPLPDRPAIAVLPFTNMSGDPEQDYFSDGISEDIITALSKLRWFFVIARNSSFIYKGKAVHMKQVAEELGVGYVVEGSVRKGGDRVRITAQLNDVATGSHHLGGALRPRFGRCVRGAGRNHRGHHCGDRAAALCRGEFSRSASRRTAWMPGIW
jgi:TolB-like protein